MLMNVKNLEIYLHMLLIKFILQQESQLLKMFFVFYRYLNHLKQMFLLHVMNGKCLTFSTLLPSDTLLKTKGNNIFKLNFSGLNFQLKKQNKTFF